MECTACCINFGSSWMNGFSLVDDDDDLVGDVVLGGEAVVVVVVVLDGVLLFVVLVELGLDLVPGALSMFALEEDAVLDVSTVVLVGLTGICDGGTCGGDLRDAFSDTDVCFVGN